MVRSVFKSWNWRTRISKVFGSEMNKSFPESPAIITSFLFLLRYARRAFTSPASPLGDTFLSPSDSAHAMHGRTEGLGDLPVLPSSSGAGEGGGSFRVSSRGSPRAGGRARPSEIPMGQGIRHRTSGGGGLRDMPLSAREGSECSGQPQMRGHKASHQPTPAWLHRPWRSSPVQLCY